MARRNAPVITPRRSDPIRRYQRRPVADESQLERRRRVVAAMREQERMKRYATTNTPATVGTKG
jgi:hypothetical protein